MAKSILVPSSFAFFMAGSIAPHAGASVMSARVVSQRTDQVRMLEPRDNENRNGSTGAGQMDKTARGDAPPRRAAWVLEEGY